MRRVALIYNHMLSLDLALIVERIHDLDIEIVDFDVASELELTETVALIFFSQSDKTNLLQYRDRWAQAIRVCQKAFLVTVEDLSLNIIPIQLRKLPRLHLDPNSLDNLKGVVEATVPIDTNQIDQSKSKMQNDHRDILQQNQAIELHQHLRTAWARASHEAINNAIFYDSLSYQIYDSNFETHLTILRQRLLDIISPNTSHNLNKLMKPLYCLQIPKSADPVNPEMREVYFAPAETSLILQLLCDRVGYALERVMNERYRGRKVSYANRMSGNPEESRTVFINWVESHNQFKKDVKVFAGEYIDTCYYRGDIRRFYPQIPKHQLMEMVERHLSYSIKVYRPLLQEFFDLNAVNSSGNIETVSGLPAGIALSNVLANLYLMELDQKMLELCFNGGYFRYADDVFIFGKDRQHVDELEGTFVRELDRLGLMPHPDKRDIRYSSDSAILETLLDGLSPFLNPPDPSLLSPLEKHWYSENIYNIINPSLSINGSEFSNLLSQEDNEEALARYGATVVRLLSKLQYDTDSVDKIAYELLRKVSLRAHHVRKLIEYLLQRFGPGYSDSEVGRLFFNTYLPVEAYDYVKIAFMQIVRENKNKITDPSIWSLVAKLSESDSIYVQGEGALTLRYAPTNLRDLEILAIKEPPLDFPSSNKDVSYVYARQLHYLYRHYGLDGIIEILHKTSALADVIESGLYLFTQELTLDA